MNSFYPSLFEGKSKSEALVDVKRIYLSESTTINTHPSFGSGFILFSDSSSIVNPSLPNYVYWIGSLLVLSFACVFLKLQLRNKC